MDACDNCLCLPAAKNSVYQTHLIIEFRDGVADDILFRLGLFPVTELIKPSFIAWIMGSAGGVSRIYQSHLLFCGWACFYIRSLLLHRATSAP